MFKLVVLSALIAVAVARPGHLHSSAVVYTAPIIQEHSFEKVGEIVKTVPTAVSWQSSSIVHRKDHVEPIIAKVVKTYALEAVHTPVVHTKTVVAEPIVEHFVEPAHPGYDIPIPIKSLSLPLEKSSSW